MIDQALTPTLNEQINNNQIDKNGDCNNFVSGWQGRINASLN